MTPDNERSLIENIKNILKQISDLEKILSTESECLRKIDPKLLNSITQQKQQQVELIKKAETDLLETLEIKVDKPIEPQTQQFITKLSQDNRETIRDLWHQLMIKTTACKKLNFINGHAVQTGLQNNERLLNILLNKEEATTVYDKRGQIK